MPVSVVVDGKLVASSRSAELSEGIVRAPMDPFVRRVAERITSDGHLITVTRGPDTLAILIGSRRMEAGGVASRLPFAPFFRRGDAVVPLAALVRALGAKVAYDPPTHTLLISSTPLPLATLTPSLLWTPPTGPLPTFAPTELPTARPTVTGIPQPRRTPVVIDPEHPAS
jgi:hypothetical protein